MAYYYGTPHKNAIHCSSMDGKPFRDLLGSLRSAARASIIRQSQTINLFPYFISKDVNDTEKETEQIFHVTGTEKVKGREWSKGEKKTGVYSKFRRMERNDREEVFIVVEQKGRERISTSCE
ncbi:hypothetical protein TNCV_494311 [Trichonephila clavipes]|nr:hypothetical protein TNCV_494311 [Trichonephila clavipes]